MEEADAIDLVGETLDRDILASGWSTSSGARCARRSTPSSRR
jgi:hypothetical protein